LKPRKKSQQSICKKKLNKAGFYPPISVSRWEFTEEIRKQEWLAKYKIKDKNIDASAAYKLIKEYYEIPNNLNDTKVRDILVIRDMLKSKGYFQYEPVQIAVDVSEKTVSTIEELSIDIPGVTVQINPIRYYPNGSLASHILGQIGRISTQEEIAKYVNEKNIIAQI
jgi:Cell division protein FtsI/penicillin-binding protein 2